MSRVVTKQSGRPRLSFRLPLDPARLLRARQRIRDYLHEFGVGANDVEDVVLAIEEAMTNAVRHSRATADLEVDLRFDENDLVTFVRDRGVGFDIHGCDLTRPPDALETCGRGLFLIAALMDDVELTSDGGVAVRGVKRALLPVDTTPRRRAEDVPPTNEEYRDLRRQAMLDELPEACAEFDWEYRYVYVNEAACRMFGRSREELTGKRLWDVFPEILGTEVEGRLRDAMELGIPSSYEFPFPPLGGWFEQRLHPIASGLSQFTNDITERKHKEFERDQFLEALRESESRLRTNQDRLRLALDAAALISFEWDIEKNVVRRLTSMGSKMDPTPEEGGTLEEVIEIVHPDDREAFRARIVAALERPDGLYENEYRIVGGNGEVSWLAARGHVQRDGEGRPVRLIGLARDVTEQRREEQALRDSEQRFRTLFESAQEGVAIHELIYEDGEPVDYRVIQVNPAYERHTGLKASDAVGRLAGELYGPAGRLHLREFAEVAQGGRPVSMEMAVSPLDRVFRLTAVSPAPGQFATIFEDITERRRLEEELRRREREARHLILSAPAGIYEIDFRGPSLTSVNDRMCEYSGYSREELLAMNPLDLLVEEDRPLFLERVQSMLSGDEIAPLVDYRVRTKTGEELRIVLDVAIKHEGGEVAGAYVVAWDVTERASAEDKLRASEEYWRTLFTTLQEDFDHPLPEVEGLDIAVVSMLAHQLELIGGDFHDVFVLPDGRVMAVIGDVMGKGIEAAGMTETVRSAIRALALSSDSPAFVLRQVNRLLRAEDREQFVSALTVLLNPDTGRGAITTAGHPPPLRFAADRIRFIELYHGPLLGTFDVPYVATAIELAPGEGLLLYTDGVTEARSPEGAVFGEDGLLRALRQVDDRRPDVLVEHVRAAVVHHSPELRDDLQILAIRRRPADAG